MQVNTCQLNAAHLPAKSPKFITSSVEPSICWPLPNRQTDQIVHSVVWRIHRRFPNLPLLQFAVPVQRKTRVDSPFSFFTCAAPIAALNPWPKTPRLRIPGNPSSVAGWPCNRVFNLRNVASSSTGKYPRRLNTEYHTGLMCPLDKKTGPHPYRSCRTDLG